MMNGPHSSYNKEGGNGRLLCIVQRKTDWSGTPEIKQQTMRRAATALQPPRARRGRYHAANLCSSRSRRLLSSSSSGNTVTQPAMMRSRSSNNRCTAPDDKANDADRRPTIPGPEVVGVTQHGPSTAQLLLQISQLQPAAAAEETTRSSRMTADPERQRATELVDRLLEGTRQLMQQQQQRSSNRHPPQQGPNSFVIITALRIREVWIRRWWRLWSIKMS